MKPKTLKAEFGQFTFLDDQTVVAEAYDHVSIDGKKVRFAIELIEKELPGDYGMILDRKATYSVLPVEVYQYFASVKRLKAIAIVSYKYPDFLPEKMEQRIYDNGKEIPKFASIREAHQWIKAALR